jgi:ubiquinone/menaquinone biosynthesis C-methylase UbiE
MSGRVELPEPVLASAIDDVPAWSAPFGAALLDRVDVRPGLVVLDVGCGTGFPALEVAHRLGVGSRVVGIDVWKAALDRMRFKAGAQGVEGVSPLRAAAEALPFADASFDVVISNNGLNNVQDEERAVAEIGRVTRPGGQLVATWNLPETMAELYRELEAALAEIGLADAVQACAAHVRDKRKPVDHVRGLLARAGFERHEVDLSSFRMRFASGRALLEHFVVRLAFRQPWEELVPARRRGELLARLRQRLDTVAAAEGEIRLTVPFACVASRRVR